MDRDTIVALLRQKAAPEHRRERTQRPPPDGYSASLCTASCTASATNARNSRPLGVSFESWYTHFCCLVISDLRFQWFAAETGRRL